MMTDLDILGTYLGNVHGRAYVWSNGEGWFRNADENEGPELTLKEKAQYLIEAKEWYGWREVRAERTILLKACDYTQLPDYPSEQKEEWATYRQALRDITNQDDPYNINWPTAPNSGG
jgi:hypothetical protein